MPPDDDGYVSDEQAVRDGVDWWYRTHIKAPPDTVAQIAAEIGEPVEMVEAWIAEAVRLLSLVRPS